MADNTSINLNVATHLPFEVKLPKDHSNWHGNYVNNIMYKSYWFNRKR
jgi:hypothetical protein